MIKKFIPYVIALGVIIGLLLLGGYSDTHYSCIAQAYIVDDSGTIFIDGAGYLWEVSDINYHKGETVKIYFNNNGTDYTREDDIILKVRRENND